MVQARAQAQTLIEFTPDEQFLIPATNGSIRFGVNGTYAQATLEDNFWIFKDLKLSRSSNTVALLNVSVTDCDITILGFSRFSSLDQAGTCHYNVSGHGTQTFNFNLEPKPREWSVIFNGDFLPEGKGWHLGDDETITVTRQSINATIFYMNLPDDVSGNSGLPFYQQHSAAISTGVVLAIVVSIAIFIRFRNLKKIKSEANI